jgi:tetratricopeptide (TPR) repeat protein
MAETLDLLGSAYGNAGDFVKGVLLSGRAIKLLRVLGDRKTLINSLAIRADNASPRDEGFTVGWSLADCERESAEALRLAREIEWADGEAFVELISGFMLASFGQLSAGFAKEQHALQIANRIDHQQWITGAHAHMAYIYLLMLAPEHALLQVESESGLALAQQLGSAWWMNWFASHKALAYLLLGQLSQAKAALQAVLPPTQPPRFWVERRLSRVWAELALAQQQPALALQRCEQLLQTAPLVPGVTDGQPIPLLLKCKGEALIALGRLEEAAQVLEEARRGAIMQQALPALWQIERALGQAYQRLQQEEQAQQAYTAARAAINELAQNIDEISLREQFAHRALSSLTRQKRASPGPAARKKQQKRENVL